MKDDNTARNGPLLTSAQLAAELNITTNDLKKKRYRGRLTPETGGPPYLWNLEKVLAQIAATIEDKHARRRASKEKNLARLRLNWHKNKHRYRRQKNVVPPIPPAQAPAPLPETGTPQNAPEDWEL